MAKEQTSDTSPNTYHNDVTVIGAGWSGLVTCKSMLEEGLSVVAIEKREGIGGVWRYSDDPTIPTVMKSTCCTSSTTVTELSDFPMPEEIGMFPHNIDVREYLESYAEKFNLMPHIRLNTGVSQVKKVDKTWHVTSSNGDIYTSTNLIIATGVIQKPNRELENTTLKGYTGKIFHASEIKAPLEEYRGKRLLLLGGGETASDLCMEWFSHVEFIYWSIPRGQHFFRKYAKVVPWGKPQALDKASSRILKTIAPYIRSKPGLSWVCKWTSNGSLLAYQGHGIPEWKNDAEFFRFFINKNGRVLDLIDYKHLIPKGGIASCNGKEITFEDGTKQEFDLVIMSTGYQVGHPYLPEQYHNKDVKELYKFIFNVEDPTIAFFGLVRPVVGSIVGISELQARLAARIYSKKVPLPPLETRKEVVRKDFMFWSNQFKQSSQRIEGLVEGFTYIDDIAKHAQIYPNYWSLFKRNPKHWFIAVSSPYNGATYRLNEPEHEDMAIQTMKSHKKSTLGPLQYILILLLRLLLFDWWLNRISDVKYYIQTSRWWPTVRAWRLTQTLNHIWTMPKQFLFDNKSDDRDESRPRHLKDATACKETGPNGLQSQSYANVNVTVNGVCLNGHSNGFCQQSFAMPRPEDSASKRRIITVANGSNQP